MATTFKTPGVYIKEIPTLPRSVVQVETAIPAFIGCTEKAEKNGKSLTNEPTRIRSLLEYEELFGKAQKVKYKEIDATDANNIKDISLEAPLKFILYYQVQMHFNNGGGPCYIISVAQYSGSSQNVTKAQLEKGLQALTKEDEPTLIMFPDAITLGNDYYELCKKALDQCNKLKDRFCIFDILSTDNDPTEGHGSQFRFNIGINNLKYGAAYYPYLQTTLNYTYDEGQVKVKGQASYKIANGILVTYDGPGTPKLVISSADTDFKVEKETLTITNVPAEGVSPDEIVKAWNTWTGNKGGFNVRKTGTGTAVIKPLKQTNLNRVQTLEEMKDAQAEMYQRVKAALNKKRVVLPPSGAVAGIYARTDRERGVWKAPANVSLNGVIAPAIKIDDEEQERLNVDPVAGKSINAIRSFTGKGTLVWGARTLDGNDNEWRYVPVRRFFNMVEESVKKATSWVVFEPNDANTWVKVKAQIEGFLNRLWRDGALAGAAPEDAFFVNVGLGTTMTSLDILEGRMNIEIGMAAVRPAEFIILKFSHKLQES